MKKYILKLLLVGMTVSTAACSFVSLDPQARDINVSDDANTLKNCKFIGNTNVSLWDKASTFQSDRTVDKQFDTLAKNSAATMNGNTVIKVADISKGQRSYGVYNCPTVK